MPARAECAAKPFQPRRTNGLEPDLLEGLGLQLLRLAKQFQTKTLEGVRLQAIGKQGGLQPKRGCTTRGRCHVSPTGPVQGFRGPFQKRQQVAQAVKAQGARCNYIKAADEADERHRAVLPSVLRQRVRRRWLSF